jgi:hypothetical protein
LYQLRAVNSPSHIPTGSDFADHDRESPALFEDLVLERRISTAVGQYHEVRCLLITLLANCDIRAFDCTDDAVMIEKRALSRICLAPYD